MKVYVAGPMSGLPEFNYPAFFHASAKLEEVGIEAINPARTRPPECKTWLDFMRHSLRDLADCDGICALSGWGDSRGASLEVHIARSLDLPVRPLADWLTKATP